MITYPLNNIEYQAEDAELFHCTRTSGVWAKGDFPFSVTGSNNSITVGKGIAWINNDEFAGKVVALKTTTILDLSIPDSVYPRIDVVAIQFNANENNTKLIVKHGEPASVPSIPPISRTTSVYELYLCKIERPAGAAVVTASNVTDLRLNPEYCGIMADSVTSVNTEQINEQITAFISKLRDAIDDVQVDSGIMLENFWSDDGKIPVLRGGTGNKSLTSNSFLVGNDTNPVKLLTPAMARGSMGLGNTTGTLSVQNGGTGQSGFNYDYFVIGNGNNSLNQLSPNEARKSMSAQKKLESRTLRINQSNKMVGKYLNMEVMYADYNSDGGSISKGRDSSSFGYGFKVNATSLDRFLISAYVTIQMNSTDSAGFWAKLVLVSTESIQGTSNILASAEYLAPAGQTVRQTLSIPLYLDYLWTGYYYLRLDQLSESDLSNLRIEDARFTMIRLS